LFHTPYYSLEPELSPNKLIVQKFLDAYNRLDHAEMLSCLTDDVEWVLPGAFHFHGKGRFEKEIKNDDYVSGPEITVTRMTEENDVVVVEGSVRTEQRDCGVMNAVFCDVFELRDAKIRKLTSILMEVKP
jgi:ketosteroid isomerase-like protein